MKLFVYGTLKRGLHNHGVLGNSEYLGSATTMGAIYHLGGFPGYKLEGRDEIHGELYEVSDELTWNRLDRLEGRPYLYDRHEKDVRYEGGEVAAQIYVFQRDVPESSRIASGRWE